MYKLRTMDFTKLTAADFKRISRLLEEKEALLRQVADIDQALQGFSGGATPARRVGRPAKAVAKAAPAAAPAGGGKRMKRGQMKETIIGLLKAAGKEGLSVKELAGKMSVKPVNVHVWFGSTGKKIAEIKKDNGRRVWVG